MFKIVLVLVLLLATSGEYVKAQLHGCLVGSATTGTLYVNTLLGYYQSTGNTYQTSAPFCPRAQLIVRDGDCYFGLLGARHDRYQYRVITTSSSPVACDIDDYAIIALGFFGLFGFIKMRRK